MTSLQGAGDNCPALLTDAHAPLEHWYAVHTRARHEKKVAAQLAQKNITHFAPTIREVHRWSDRRAVVEVPLFSSYAFVRTALCPRVRLAVLGIPGVLGFVGFNKGPAPIPDAEIESIETILRNNVPFSTTTFVKTGEKVRIRGGALDGVEGVMVGRNGKQQLLVSVELIQQSITVTLAGYELERISVGPEFERRLTSTLPASSTSRRAWRHAE